VNVDTATTVRMLWFVFFSFFWISYAHKFLFLVTSSLLIVTCGRPCWLPVGCLAFHILSFHVIRSHLQGLCFHVSAVNCKLCWLVIALCRRMIKVMTDDDDDDDDVWLSVSMITLVVMDKSSLKWPIMCRVGRK